MRVLARQVEAQLELRRLNAELARVDAVREQLMQFLAHDLSSPLTAISLTTAALCDSPSLEARRSLGEEITAATESLQSMIADLRDASVGRAGALAPRYQDVDLGPLLDSAAQSVRAQCRERGVELHIANDCHGLVVEVDPHLVRRLVVNLLSNACHHATSAVEVGGRAVGTEQFELFVDDDGAGVTDDRKSNIFDLYARAPERQAEFSRGIGLAFCRTVAHAHRGTIEVLDRQPRGSRFRAVIPCQPPVHAAQCELGQK